MKFYEPFTWSGYSEVIHKAIMNPHNRGIITEDEAKMSEMRLAVGEGGRLRDGNKVVLYLLVDEEDGLIADAKFQAFGDSALIAAVQILCGLVLRKNYDQAARMSANLIDKAAGDAFPKETYPHLNLVLTALTEACEKCHDIPFADDYAPPVPFSEGFEGEPAYPNFDELSEEQKRSVLEQVIEEDIRPFIELDAGGVDVTKIEGMTLTITYKGNCTSCYSATGATLSAIQSLLRAKVNRELTVVPDLASLSTPT